MRKFNKRLYDNINREYDRKNLYLYEVSVLQEKIEAATGKEKQDLENRFWELFNGGRIQYVRYNLSYNSEAMLTYIERAMELGFYEGVNLSLAYCNKCGHEELDMDVCPKCGSSDLTKIDRMNGYLSYSRVHGDTMLSNAKMVEISERKSM